MSNLAYTQRGWSYLLSSKLNQITKPCSPYPQFLGRQCDTKVLCRA